MKDFKNSGNLWNESITIERISKIKAIELFNNGSTILMQTSNKIPFDLNTTFCPIFQKLGNFSELIKEFKFYNCNSINGKYIKFYKSI